MGCLDMECLDIGRTIKVFKDNMFQPDRFLGEYAKVVMGCLDMWQTQGSGPIVEYKSSELEAKGPEVVKCGPWGGTEGMQFDDGRHYTGAREIQLTRSGGGLVSIQVLYDFNGEARWGKEMVSVSVEDRHWKR
ncbi:hypothetical protein ACB092_01G425400 [Castanea dentata]